MIGAELTMSGNKYSCPECKKKYTWRWIRRHLVSEHGYAYYRDILYNPNDPENALLGSSEKGKDESA